MIDLGDVLVGCAATHRAVTELLGQTSGAPRIEHRERSRVHGDVAAVDEQLDLAHILLVEVEELRAPWVVVTGRT